MKRQVQRLVGDRKYSFVSHLLFILLIALLLPVLASAQNKCRVELQQAERRYNQGRFDEAISLLRACLHKSGIADEDRKAVYELLGKTFVAKNYLKGARVAIQRLLKLAPNFEPDPIQDPPAFIKMVMDIKNDPRATSPILAQENQPKKKGGSKKWLFLGGGALVAGSAAAFLLLMDGGGNVNLTELPQPPNFP